MVHTHVICAYVHDFHWAFAAVTFATGWCFGGLLSYGCCSTASLMPLMSPPAHSMHAHIRPHLSQDLQGTGARLLGSTTTIQPHHVCSNERLTPAQKA